MNNKTIKDVKKAINPQVMTATCAGSELFQVAWCHGDKIALKRTGEPTPVTMLLLKVPLGTQDGVKRCLQLKVADIPEYAAKNITMFSTVTVAGVATQITETSVDGKLAYVTYVLKVGKVTVEPCADAAIKEFDEPIAQVCLAQDETEYDE